LFCTVFLPIQPNVDFVILMMNYFCTVKQTKMNKLLRYIYFLNFLVLFSNNITAQVNVTDSLSANQLVQKLLGSGVNYTNAVLICDSLAEGTFVSVSSNLGLDSGIILSSGRLEEGDYMGFMQPGMNNPANDLASTDFSLIGNDYQDADLDAILDPTGTSSRNACKLEFDFIPSGDSISFRYVFGSEEYTNYSCTAYNDIFAFFLTGPGYLTATNIARIPGTNIPVAVNSTTDTLLNGNGPDCTSMGPGSPFSQYYIDNLSGTTIVYNGFTTVFTAAAAVQPCSTYHIKLAIADAGDGALDSGVFLEAGSFNSNSVATDLSFASTVPSNNTSLLEGCYNGVVTVKRLQALPVPQVVHLTYSGSAVKDMDYSGAPDSVIIPAFDSLTTFTIAGIDDISTEGIEMITIAAAGGIACGVVSNNQINIPILEQPQFVLVSHDTSTCDGELTVALHVQSEPGLQFSWSANPSVTIPNPTDTLTFVTTSVTTVFTVNASNGICPAGSASFTVTLGQAPLVNIIPSDTTVCLKDSMQIMVTVEPEGNYTYDWSPANNLGDAHTRQPFFFSDILNDYTYYLTVTSPAGCMSGDSVTIHTRPGVTLANVTADATIKYGEDIQLNAEGARNYTWVPEIGLNNAHIHDPIATTLFPMTYIVVGENEFGCRDSASVNVNIDYSMTEFVPTVFSPNHDGKNDVFRLVGITYQTLESFRVYNRFGQVVFDTKDITQGWDGKFMGELADIGVYQYLIRLNVPDGTPDGKEKMLKGDVTLIR
jgi:gliding motility-associated-like protein